MNNSIKALAAENKPGWFAGSIESLDFAQILNYFSQSNRSGYFDISWEKPETTKTVQCGLILVAGAIRRAVFSIGDEDRQTGLEALKQFLTNYYFKREGICPGAFYFLPGVEVGASDKPFEFEVTNDHIVHLLADIEDAAANQN